MNLQARRKAFQAAFKQRLSDFEIKGATLEKLDEEGAVFACADGASAFLHVASVKRGYGPGEFGMYSGVTLSGGPVFETMKATKLAESEVFSDDQFFRFNTLNVGEDGKHYHFVEDADVETVVAEMVKDMKKYFVPLVRDFTADYNAGVDFIVAHRGKHVRNPYTAAVILLGLAGRFDRLPEITAVAEKLEAFYDYHEASDPAKTIVAPIRARLEKQGAPRKR